MKIPLATFLICTSVGLAVDDPLAGKVVVNSARPSGNVLLEKVSAIEKDGPPEEMRRNISEGVKALVEADRAELMSTMNLLFTEGSQSWDVREMMVTQALARFPDEPVFKLKASDVQRMLASKDERRWMPDAIAEALGAKWFREDGTKAIKRLGTLPHAKDLDPSLFEGMCRSAKAVDEHLALLTWFVGPGRRLGRFEKGYHPVWERLLTNAAELDLEKTRNWMELHFPPKTMRTSDKEEADWDIANLRQDFYFAWARTKPLEAIQWRLAQNRDDDPDAYRLESIYLNGVRSIAQTSEGGLKAGLAWLQGFQDKPAFIKTAAKLLDGASRDHWDDTDLQVMGGWMSALPLAVRERILIFSKNNSLVRFLAKPDERFLKLCCPDEEERATVVAHLVASLKQPEVIPEEDYLNAHGHEFNLPRRRMGKTSTAEALATARHRLEQYIGVTTSLDPKERLESLPVLDWLAAASTAELQETLQAHLENMHGELDEWIPSGCFALKLIETWSAKDWPSCERFGWEAQMPAATRRQILIYCFQYAADRHPDEIYARVSKLISEGQMWSLALAGDGESVQYGGNCFAGYIPVKVGRSWARNDPKAVAKLASSPLGWQLGALKGASGAFTKAEVGVGLLDWIVEQEDQDPKARKFLFDRLNPAWDKSVTVRYRRAEQRAFQRLVEIDVNAARGWLEAVPARMAPSSLPCDEVFIVHRAMQKQDAAAADAWLRRVRPETPHEPVK